MNIKILDSWLREFLKTDATPKQIAEKLSLTSVSVERLEKIKTDYLYDIEVTTNRPELMSVIGLAREAAASLSHNGIKASFIEHTYIKPTKLKNTADIKITNDKKLVNRICAVIMEVYLKESSERIKTRLEATDIRSLNNIIDVTNYVMRTTGHPTHVFDYDRLITKKMIIREAKKGEKLTTLDNKIHKLNGGEIVIDNGKGEIIDLMGVMGTANSVVTDDTKRILFFVDNVEPIHIRKTSMSLGIRTEAAVINEKALDPELSMQALLYGIELYQKNADAKIISEIIDIYPNKLQSKPVKVTEKQINTVIGVSIPVATSAKILQDLGFETKVEDSTITATPPIFRAKDIQIPEDLIEEIARIYGYHNVPNELPPMTTAHISQIYGAFYWEDHIKNAMKYWGFTEVYTYPMVSEELIGEEKDKAVTIANPLSEEFVYMREHLTPSHLKVIQENKDHDTIKIFEIANIYKANGNKLPEQLLTFAGVIKKKKVSFFEIKGILEALFSDLGIENIEFQNSKEKSSGAEILIAKKNLGTIEIISDDTIAFEISCDMVFKYATQKKKYIPVSKFPAVIEDLAVIISQEITTGKIISTIKSLHPIINTVTLMDKYKETRTFHIVYQSNEKNLTNEDITPIREKIISTLKDKFHAQIK